MIVQYYGKEALEEIKMNTSTRLYNFLNYESYSDNTTLQLIESATQTLGIAFPDFMQLFGKYWILDTTTKHYNYLMGGIGSSLKEFLLNLPDFHGRVILNFPNLTPPLFHTTDVLDNSLQLHYISTRNGLTEFVKGLLYGLSELYNQSILVEILAQKQNGDKHDIFKIIW
jgi:hypothetical protein